MRDLFMKKMTVFLAGIWGLFFASAGHGESLNLEQSAASDYSFKHVTAREKLISWITAQYALAGQPLTQEEHTYLNSLEEADLSAITTTICDK